MIKVHLLKHLFGSSVPSMQSQGFMKYIHYPDKDIHEQGVNIGGRGSTSEVRVKGEDKMSTFVGQGVSTVEGGGVEAEGQH